MNFCNWDVKKVSSHINKALFKFSFVLDWDLYQEAAV